MDSEVLRSEEGDMPNPNFALADGLLLEERKYFCPVNIPLCEIKTVRTEKDIFDEMELVAGITVCINNRIL